MSSFLRTSPSLSPLNTIRIEIYFKENHKYQALLRSMSPNGPELIYGAAALWTATDSETSATLDLLAELGIRKVDSAELYGSSEELLGRAHAAVRFEVSTKLSTAMEGAEQASPDIIVRHAQESLRKLQTKAVSSLQPNAILHGGGRPKYERITG